jgi:hypothetical protein
MSLEPRPGLTFVAGVALAIALSACRPGDAPKEPTEPNEPTDPTVQTGEEAPVLAGHLSSANARHRLLALR